MTEPGARADPAYLLDASGPAAPPRRNGELIFAAPWESRVFGIALALHDGGYFEWEAFRQALIVEVQSWEADHLPGEEWSYYRCWQRALERLVAERGLTRADALEERLNALVARPAGHDHGDGGHDHRDGGHDHRDDRDGGHHGR